jgi:hypothetical protein
MSKQIETLDRIGGELHNLCVDTQPRSDRDINFRLNSALEVARDQVYYAARILRKRIPDPRQPSLFEEAQEMVKWCDRCQNPKGACTCP